MAALRNAFKAVSLLFLFLVVNKTSKNLKIDEAVSVCLYFASDSADTVEVIIIQLSTVTGSDMIMYHVLIISTWTCIKGHTDRTHENN